MEGYGYQLIVHFMFSIVESIGQKLILKENKVKYKTWSFVLISTDMGSVVSPG